MFERITLAATTMKMRKKRKEYAKLPVTGKRLSIPRSGADPIDCIVYQPVEQGSKYPLFVELHGGGWYALDAAVLDSFSRKIADETPAVVVSLNYKKLDVHPFPYPQTELCDLIAHFISNAEAYSIDPAQIVICGQSAGAHISAGAAIMAKERGIKIAKQILVYPYVDFTGSLGNLLEAADKSNQKMVKIIHERFFKIIDKEHRYVSPLVQDSQVLAGIAPAAIIVCGIDELRPHGLSYDRKLKQAGVSSVLKEYPKAVHGFLEVNRPDFIDDNPAKSPEQATYARECETFIIDLVKQLQATD